MELHALTVHSGVGFKVHLEYINLLPSIWSTVIHAGVHTNTSCKWIALQTLLLSSHFWFFSTFRPLLSVWNRVRVSTPLSVCGIRCFFECVLAWLFLHLCSVCPAWSKESYSPHILLSTRGHKEVPVNHFQSQRNSYTPTKRHAADNRRGLTLPLFCLYVHASSMALWFFG